jgi:hypothetical protein
MRSMIRLAVSLCVAVVGVTAVLGSPAVANTKATTVIHSDFRFAIDDWCDFPVRFHVVGSYKRADYYNGNGSLYKTIWTAGAGSPYRWTASANGDTLTMQMQSFMQVNTYNPDGSVDAFTIHGVDLKFTAKGDGVVLQDVGTVVRDGDFDVISVSGPHQSLSGAFDAFSAALSP